MAYTLQAILTSIPNLDPCGIPMVSLPREITLLPLVTDPDNLNAIPFLPLTDGGEQTIGKYLNALCASLSRRGKLAYVEAEIFGDMGTQACAMYELGNQAQQTLINEAAINHALRWLGVEAIEKQDEFDTVGLGKHRNTEDWIQEST